MVEVDLFIRIALFYTGRRTPGDCYQLSVRTTQKQQSIPRRAQMVYFAQHYSSSSSSSINIRRNNVVGCATNHQYLVSA